MLEPLKANKYKYSAGSMTGVNPSSGKVGAFNIDSMLAHRENEGFLKQKFLLVVGVGRHRFSRIPKLVSSEKPSTE